MLNLHDVIRDMGMTEMDYGLEQNVHPSSG